MKRKFLKNIKILAGIALSALLLNSCSDMLEVDSRDTVAPKNMYQNKFDANAAVLGVYSKMKNLAQEYVILNELRGDLMDVTPNADQYLRQINDHDAGIAATNPYINPAPFYEVILSCNDVMYNLEKMYENNKLKKFEFEERYSDVGALRCWLYYQLINQFGAVPYITQPLTSIEEVKDSTDFPKLEYNAMIDTLINFMETKVTFKGRYSEIFISLDYTSYMRSSEYVDFTFAPKYIILGDLYLAKGDYTNAEANYKAYIALYTSFTSALETNLESHRVAYNAFMIYPNDNTSSIVNNWMLIFSIPLNTSKTKQSGGSDTYPSAVELEWVVPFDANYDSNPLLDLFAWNKKYLLKPSLEAIDNWNSQYMTNGTLGDRRGDGASWYTIDNKPMVMKYLLEYATPIGNVGLSYRPFFKGGRYMISRAGLLNLRIAEAANRAGYPRIAMALMNRGINAEFGSRSTGTPAPFEFAGMNNNNQTWYRNTGIRNRAGLKPIVVPAGSTQDSINFIEDKLIEEAALETAFEGNRWTDLVRIAKRRNDPSFLADKIYEKLRKAGNPNADAARARLLDEKNWFLPFRW